MLTIGRLAAYAGVTVRAVRHYHQRGLLAEPARDASGYRRYDAQAVIDLIRIKTLSDAGVPLARIKDLLSAEPEPFAQAMAQISAALAAKIRDLEGQRHRLGELTGGERLFLPDEVADYLSELRALGVSQRTVQMERDGWILLMALSPEQVPDWIAQKRSALADAEFGQLYLACDQALDWDPADPRLADLADAMVAFTERRQPQWRDEQASRAVGDPAAIALVASQFDDVSPAWKRLNELCQDRMKAAGGGAAAAVQARLNPS